MKPNLLCLCLLLCLSGLQALAAEDQVDEAAAATSAHQSGIKLLESNKLDEALAKFDEALGHQKDSVKIFYARGTAWRWKGDLARAMADYQQAATLKPSESTYQLEIEAMNYSKARDLIDEAVKKNKAHDVAGSASLYQSALRMVKSDSKKDQLRQYYKSESERPAPGKLYPPCDAIPTF